jgi:glycosyltransferase involved in cell wall biosynthesis
MPTSVEPHPGIRAITLSILMPVYNERATVARAILAASQALPTIDKEIIIVDDGSVDGTGEDLARGFGAVSDAVGGFRIAADGSVEMLPIRGGAFGRVRFRLMRHERNAGKGAALATAMGLASGDVIVIHDADLEYDPDDWADMYHLIVHRQVADVVYGSRFYGRAHRSLYFHHYLANRLISLLFNLLYNQTLTDIETCYKMFSRPVLQSLRPSCRDFGFEIEISAQIARARRWRIYELGIHYYGRTYAEGKKVSWRDGAKALWYLFRYRI